MVGYIYHKSTTITADDIYDYMEYHYIGDYIMYGDDQLVIDVIPINEDFVYVRGEWKTRRADTSIYGLWFVHYLNSINGDVVPELPTLFDHATRMALFDNMQGEMLNRFMTSNTKRSLSVLP